MKNKQQGFIGAMLVIFIAFSAVLGGAYVYNQSKKAEENINIENNFKKEIEKASSTQATTTVVLGVTPKTKTPITAEVSVKSNIQRNKDLSIVVNQEQLNKGVTEKYKNTPFVNRLTKLRVQASFSSFFTEALEIKSKDGFFNNVCVNAKTFIEADIKKSIDENDGLMKALGINLSSYHIEQILCKATSDNFVISMPVDLEDGSSAKVCSSATVMGLVGDVNYETYACVKK